MSLDALTRRTVLRGAGAAMALPWLEAMAAPIRNMPAALASTPLPDNGSFAPCCRDVLAPVVPCVMVGCGNQLSCTYGSWSIPTTLVSRRYLAWKTKALRRPTLWYSSDEYSVASSPKKSGSSRSK